MGNLDYKTSKTGKHINYEMSDLQKLAQKENFALFTLMSMKANLMHVKKLPDVPVTSLEYQIDAAIASIKAVQYYRKRHRNTNKKASNIK